MSKREYGKIITTKTTKKINKTNDKLQIRKCSHHVYSYQYADNMKKHDDILKTAGPQVASVDMNTNINAKVLFHILLKDGTYTTSQIRSQVSEVLMSVNNDFNNYTTNANSLNNFKYRSVVNQVFMNNMDKQRIYLGEQYLNTLPINSSNIIFELGNIYYYPVKNSLNLNSYNDVTEVELEMQAIKQFIYQNRANAIEPDKYINIWIIDMIGTGILGFSNFPWESFDASHGIIINSRCFLPDNIGEKNFNQYKTFSHEIGHYFGLLHVFSQNSSLGAYAAVNLHSDNALSDNTGDYILDTPTQLNPTYDPMDTQQNQRLHTDATYNPLFMNFMDYTYDRYVTMFTRNQIQKMRYMIFSYRKNLITANQNNTILPIGKFDPDTKKIIINTSNNQKTTSPSLITNVSKVNATGRLSQINTNVNKNSEEKKYTKYGQLNTTHQSKETNKIKYTRTRPINM